MSLSHEHANLIKREAGARDQNVSEFIVGLVMPGGALAQVQELGKENHLLLERLEKAEEKVSGEGGYEKTVTLQSNSIRELQAQLGDARTEVEATRAALAHVSGGVDVKGLIAFQDAVDLNILKNFRDRVEISELATIYGLHAVQIEQAIRRCMG